MKVTLSQSAWKSGSPRIDSKRRLAISLVSGVAKFHAKTGSTALRFVEPTLRPGSPTGRKRARRESRPTNLLLARFLVGRRSTRRGVGPSGPESEPKPAFIHFSRKRPRDRRPPLRHNRETTSNGSTCDRCLRANGSRCNASIAWQNERAKRIQSLLATKQQAEREHERCHER